ncbi:MAG: hypothetical protein GTO63_30325 [Anaerolineae bacterium]|nr:hypothetical protein [Anaerolineae bacterium]NIN99002.1 hypothetical protein [Anaerolineae bacterium]
MGNLTLEDFRDRSLSRAQRPAFDTAEHNEAVNAVILDLADIVDFKELEAIHSITMVAGTATEALPSDWLRYYQRGGRITTTDKRQRIRPRSRETFLMLSDPTAQSLPDFFHVYAGNVIFDPVPDDAYTAELDYQKRPTLLTGDTSVSPYDPEWDEAIVRGVIAKVYERYQEHEVALKANNDFIDEVRKRRPAAQREPWPDIPLQPTFEESKLRIRG